MILTTLAATSRWVAPFSLACLCALHAHSAQAPQAQEDRAAVSQELASAKTEATRANARLALANARQAVLDHEWTAARQQALQALSLLRTLPKSDEVTDQTLMAEGILHRANSQTAPAQPASTLQPMQPLNQPVPTQRTAPAPQSHDEPEATPANVGSSDFDDAGSQYARQAQIVNDYKSDELRELIAVDESRRIPSGWVEYPPEWPQKARKRNQQYPGGLIARGPSQNLNGQDWYWGVYDISDLIYVPPDFASPVQMNPVVAFRTWMDRNALLWYGNGSYLGPGYGGVGAYGGYGGCGGWWGGVALGGFGAADALTSDPQTVLNMARYFGGVDDFMWRGPKYSTARQKQIEELVKFITQASGPTPQVFTLDPVLPPP